MNKNKKEQKAKLNGLTKNFRDRKHKILFMDLRKLGVPFEKKFIQFSDEDIDRITSTYHNWQIKDGNYKDIPEFCYSSKIEEVRKKDYSLVPSKYIEFVNRDENVDYDEKMKTLQKEIGELLKEEEKSKKELLKVFKELGYGIKL